MDSEIGWRVEFRTMDIQVTDYENTAMIVLLLMLNNVINNFDVDFIVPITKVDENMERAHAVDGLLTQKFWVKTKGAFKSFENTLEETDFLASSLDQTQAEEQLIEELTMEQILSGSKNFIGLIPLFQKFMEMNEWT